MATSKLSASDGWCGSQLNIVLLGGRNSGKRSLGNLLLGREEFASTEGTPRCCRRLGLAAGRRLAVVDAPGWWCDARAQDTCALVKGEILSSVSLCPPGPHVLLVAVKLSSAFTEKRRRAVEEHVGLLGEGVWDHCMVVLTGEGGGAGGEALRWLSRRCGRRCHRVTLRDEAEVAELLRKMQTLVAQNGNRVFEMEESVVQEAAERRRRVEARAQQRAERTRKLSALMRQSLRPVTDIRIVLLGAKGSGKTSALNTILCRETSRPLGSTARCSAAGGLVFGRRLTVVDTPGWWINYFCHESSVFDRRETALALGLCPPGPHVFLLVVRADRAFSDAHRRAAREHLRLIGEQVWRRVLVLFSFGDWLGGAGAERHIESEGRPLRRLVRECGDRYHVLNNKSRGDGLQVRELIGKIEGVLCGRDGGWHYEVERKVMEQLQEEVRREEARAEERLMRRNQQRRTAKARLENLSPLAEIHIVLIGGSKTGKSSCGNTILSRECFATNAPTASCAERSGLVAGRRVTVLDTPSGFSVTPDLLTPPRVLLLVVNPTASFTRGHWEAAAARLQAGGERAWRRAAVLFSHGDRLGGAGPERRVESEGEALRRLVEACGNRYHALDNKRRGGGAQVAALIDLTEEILAEEGPVVLGERGRTRERAPSARERTPEAARHNGEEEFVKVMIHTRQLSRGLSGSASCPALDRSEAPGAVAQIEAVSAAGGLGGRRLTGGDGFMSRLACGGLKWAPAVCPFPPTRLLVEERVMAALPGPRGPQAPTGQRGGSSLEELEAFIDSHFEAVWEQTAGSGRVAIEQRAAVEVPEEEEALESINRKLTKLELLEEVRRDVAELRERLKHIEERRESNTVMQ